MHIFIVPPQITPFEFGEDTVNSGDVAIATCTVIKGDFPMDITWTLNDKSVKDVHGVSVIHTKRSSQVSIDSVVFEHTGEYTCAAKNAAGYSTYSAVLNVNGI